MFTIVRKRLHSEPFLKGEGSKQEIKKISDEKKSLNELVTFDDKIDLNVVEVSEYHEKVKAAYNRIYYIADGFMHLLINNQEIALQKGDACFVEKGTLLELEGTFTVMIVSNPSPKQ